MTVQELAEIDVIPGTEADFEAAVAEAAPQFQTASGCRALELRRSVEHPSRYRLFVEWDTVEHHTVAFRESEGFAIWRSLVGQHFVSPPRVEHIVSVLKAF
jgi:heme-degrading monooxygenase HmoA